MVKLAKINLNYKSKIIGISNLSQKLKKFSNINKKIGFTNGCFDILHKGHFNLFKFCRKKCDILIVAVNSNISVKKIKGKKRPYNNLRFRLISLSRIKEIDYIVYFHKLDSLELIKKIKPNFLFKGSDYNIKNIIGSKYIKSYGGKTILAPYTEGYSTTDIIKKK